MLHLFIRDVWWCCDSRSVSMWLNHIVTTNSYHSTTGRWWSWARSSARKKRYCGNLGSGSGCGECNGISSSGRFGPGGGGCEESLNGGCPEEKHNLDPEDLVVVVNVDQDDQVDYLVVVALVRQVDLNLVDIGSVVEVQDWYIWLLYCLNSKTELWSDSKRLVTSTSGWRIKIKWSLVLFLLCHDSKTPIVSRFKTRGGCNDQHMLLAFSKCMVDMYSFLITTISLFKFSLKGS